MPKTTPVRSITTGAFIVPTYDISGRMINGRYEFLYIPTDDHEVGWEVYGYKYKTGTGWKLLAVTETRSEAQKIAREHHDEMVDYWDL